MLWALFQMPLEVSWQWVWGEEEIYRNVCWVVLFVNILGVFIILLVEGQFQHLKTVILILCFKQQAYIRIL